MQVFGRNPFAQRRPTQPPVKLQLAPGMGSEISVDGQTYTADETGFIEVPAEFADQVRAHLPSPEASSSGWHDITAEKRKIAKIDERLSHIAVAMAEIDAAIKRATEMQRADSGSGAETAALEVERRRTIASVLREKAAWVDVDVIEAKKAQAVERAAADERARGLATIGVDELYQQHRFPLEAEALELKTQRAQAARRIIRARAEQAAIAYRTALSGAAQAFAEVQAFAEALEAIERPNTTRQDFSGGRQGFDFYRGREIGPLPAFPALRAFHGTGFNVSITPDSKAARARMVAALAGDGIQL